MDTDKLEFSDYLRDPRTDMLRGCLLPLVTAIWLVIVGLALTALAGAVIALLRNLFVR
jgi:hypothetical protein